MDGIDINTIYNQLNYLDETKSEIKQALINKGQEISDSQTFRSYVDNINNLGMLKQFNTVNEMEEDTTAKDGDIALVYNLNEEEFEFDKYFNNIWFVPQASTNMTLSALCWDVSETAGTYSDYHKTYEFKTMDGLSTLKYTITVTSKSSGSGWEKATFEFTCDGESITFLANEDYVIKRQDDIQGPLTLSTIVDKNFGLDGTGIDVTRPTARNQLLVVLPLLAKFGTSDFTGLYKYSNITNNWEFAPTQLTAVESDGLSVRYYGPKGVTVGEMDTKKYFNDATVNNAMKYLNTYYNLFQTVDITNIENYWGIRSLVNDRKYVDWINISNRTNISNLFNNMRNLRYLDVSNWDMSNVENAVSAFAGCSNLCTLDFKSNTSFANIINAYRMFSNCQSMTRFDVVNLDFSNCVNTSFMFSNCYALRTINILGWNMSNVLDGSYMFSYCNSISGMHLGNNVYSMRFPNALNLSRMFLGSGIQNLGPHYWGPHITFYAPKVTNISGIFSDCNAITVSANFISSVISTQAESLDASYMFTNSTVQAVYNLNLGVAPITNAYGMFMNCNSMQSLDDTTINLSKAKNASRMFYQCRKLTNLSYFPFGTIPLTNNTVFTEVEDASEMFYYCTGINNIQFRGGKLLMPNVKTTARMFAGCSNLNTIAINWNMPNLVNAVRMFSESNIKQFDLSRANLDNLSNIVNMFGKNWTSVTLTNAYMPNITNFTLDYRDAFNVSASYVYMSNLNICNATTFEIRVGRLKEINLYNIKTGEIASGNNMMANCYNLLSVNLASVNLSPNINSMNYMFSPCYDITSIGFNNNYISTSPSVNTISMFDQDQKLKTITPSNFFANMNITNAPYMFQNCQNVDNLTINLESAINTFEMCNNCRNLANFTTTATPKVTNMARMFYLCTNLLSMPAQLDTTNVTNMRAAFYNCYKFTNVLPNLNLENIVNDGAYGLYWGCINLVDIDVSNYKLSKALNIGTMFTNCNNLSNNSIQSIINMVLNATNVTAENKNLDITKVTSPFYCTPFDNSYYQDRWQELDDAGWSY